MAVLPTAQKKSGLKILRPGDVLFNENDPAESMYIIQKGQLRLFRPKGRGFVEIGVLRAGEVIGEMAYFDATSRKRSCSATAIMQTEVIEISFNALDKTMSQLNPWFKTLINTLADRLRKSNERVKTLESNNMGFGGSGKVAEYKFYQAQDIVRIISVLFLTYKAHGEFKDNTHQVHTSRVKFYMHDIFNVQESKYEEFLQLLKDERFMEVAMDEDGLPRMLAISDPEMLRQFQVFFNSQRIVDDSKKLVVTPKCERFLQQVMEQVATKPVEDGKVQADLSAILDWNKERNIPMTIDDFQDALRAKFADELVVGSGGRFSTMVNIDYLKKMYPCVRLMNAINRINESKAKQQA